MPKVTLYKTDGTSAGEVELSEEIFAAPVNINVMHDVVVAHLANLRQGTQSALTRAEVRGGGIKPFRQKGTGRARQGSSRSPQYEGGGVVFAPKPRDYSKKINKKARRVAIKSALSSKTADDALIVVEDFSFQAPKTKEMTKILDALGVKNALIVIDGNDQNVVRSARNIADVDMTDAQRLNVYDVLNHEKLILTSGAVKALRRGSHNERSARYHQTSGPQ